MQLLDELILSLTIYIAENSRSCIKQEESLAMKYHQSKSILKYLLNTQDEVSMIIIDHHRINMISYLFAQEITKTM